MLPIPIHLLPVRLACYFNCRYVSVTSCRNANNKIVPACLNQYIMVQVTINFIFLNFSLFFFRQLFACIRTAINMWHHDTTHTIELTTKYLLDFIFFSSFFSFIQIKCDFPDNLCIVVSPKNLLEVISIFFFVLLSHSLSSSYK